MSKFQTMYQQLISLHAVLAYSPYGYLHTLPCVGRLVTSHTMPINSGTANRTKEIQKSMGRSEFATTTKSRLEESLSYGRMSKACIDSCAGYNIISLSSTFLPTATTAISTCIYTAMDVDLY